MWNDRYSDAFSAYGTEPNDYLQEVAARIPSGPVLGLGEGEGRNAVFLAQRGHSVTAVDQSEVGLNNAKLLAEQRGTTLETVVADLANYDPGENKWSGIISIWCHLPSSIRVPLHQACVRALKPGGVFVLEAYSSRQLERPGVGGPKDLDWFVSVEGIEQELAGLTFDRCVEVDREVSEGKFHHGPSSTVQVFATKP